MSIPASIIREIPSKRCRPEDTLQMALVEHLRFRARPGVIWHSTPNEGLRSAREGARLKRMGLRPGAGDLLFVLPPEGRAAYLELKAGKDGRQSAAQKQFEADALAAGARYALVRTIDDALSILIEWGVIR